MMLLAHLLACSEVATAPDPGFRVTGVAPEDGAVDVVEAQVPELRFSDATDPDLCDADTIELDAIDEDGAVAFGVDIGVVDLDGGFRLQLQHDEPLPRGWTYALSARAGDEDGCLSVGGAPLEPFASRFTVAP